VASGLDGETVETVPNAPQGLDAVRSTLQALRSKAGSAGSDPCRVLIFADQSVTEKQSQTVIVE